APSLPIGDKELLLGSQVAVFRAAFLRQVYARLLSAIEICEKSQLQPAQVGDVFSQSELAVHMQIIDGDKSVVLLDHTIRALGKLLCVVCRPPVCEIAMPVELSSFVIEAMGQFM